MDTEEDPPRAQLRLTTVLAALSDPTRLATVQTLGRLGSTSAGHLRRFAGIESSESTFSHHQKVLRDAGIVDVSTQGARRILSLRREDLDAAFPGLLKAIIASRPAAPATW